MKTELNPAQLAYFIHWRDNPSIMSEASRYVQAYRQTHGRWPSHIPFTSGEWDGVCVAALGGYTVFDAMLAGPPQYMGCGVSITKDAKEIRAEMVGNFFAQAVIQPPTVVNSSGIG